MTNGNLHPCFNSSARHEYGRIHLPVAAKCNIQCHYCNRKYHCANESRPGVSRTLLSPGQALVYLSKSLGLNPKITVVGIAGPGDPFANPEETMETIRRVRERFPALLLCVATNGLNLLPYIGKLAEYEVSHVTLTINAVDPEVGKEIYAWVRDGKVVYRGMEGVALLLERQFRVVAELKKRGITVKINTILVPGINEDQVEKIAARAAALGADVMNCIPMVPVEETVFASIRPPEPEMMEEIRKGARVYLPQMEHCARCRADAVGLLGTPLSGRAVGLMEECASMPLNPEDDRPYVAVASMEGIFVNEHLGRARDFLIYGPGSGRFEFIERRIAPEPGNGIERWRQLAGVLGDCRAVLVSNAGESPQEVLGAAGIQVFETEGLIVEALHAVYHGEPVRRTVKRVAGCGRGCSGSGVGCG